MATQVVLPLLGQTMEEGTIIKWFKKEGEKIEKGEPLLEVQTDKVNMEVEAPESGTLLKIVAPEEAIIPVHDLIAVLGEPGEKIDDILAGAKAEEPAPAETAAVQIAAQPAAAAVSVGGDGDRVFASPRAKMVAQENGLDINLLAGKGTGDNGRIVEADITAFIASLPTAPRATPLAGKVAVDQGVDLSSVTPSGISGKIVKDDVLKAAAPASSAAAFIPAGPRPKIGKVIPFTGMRKAVADNVDKSFKNAHVTLVMEADMTEVVKLRKQILEPTEKLYGVRISYTDIITKACAVAMYYQPIVNSTFDGKNITILDAVGPKVTYREGAALECGRRQGTGSRLRGQFLDL